MNDKEEGLLSRIDYLVIVIEIIIGGLDIRLYFLALHELRIPLWFTGIMVIVISGYYKRKSKKKQPEVL